MVGDRSIARDHAERQLPERGASVHVCVYPAESVRSGAHREGY